MDLHDPRFLAVLKSTYQGHAPHGYAEWLDRTIAHYDPVFRAWRLRESHSIPSREQHSHKCWDDSCVHYIYGYSQSSDRDRHARDHALSPTRDSALSISDTPISPFLGHQRGRSSQKHSLDYSQRDSTHYLPQLGANAHQLAPMMTGGPPMDNRDSLKTYSFVSEYPGGPRGSIDSEVDPLLPPPKRPRLGQPRLESIGELMLKRDVAPCLRCKVLEQSVRFRSSPGMNPLCGKN